MADPVPGYANRGFVGGANHHIGDAGFQAAYHREPKPGEEHARIHEHFIYVEKMLASRPATKPELAAKRAALLAYFDDYIRRDITPENRNLPWRAPVFIDDKGTICAVGYLIEKSAGRPLAEKVAASHKFDYIDDIAAKMPDVKAWADASGLSLEELASIQPGYIGPLMEQYQMWDSQDPKLLGDYDEKRLGHEVVGQFRGHRMEGAWKVVDETDPDVVVGSGTLHHGTGAWSSFYDDGKLMAKGRYVRNLPTGRWQMFHPSGNLAAEGNLRQGLRDGRWTFYYDTADKTPIAIGRFYVGGLSGSWRHFDAHGKLLARTDGQLVTVVPGADKVEHEIFQRTRYGDHVDRFALGHDQIYVVTGGGDGEAMYDQNGHQIQKVDGRWAESVCELPRHAIAAARATDITTFATVMLKAANDPVCDEYQPVSDARAARITQILTPHDIVRAQTPDFVRSLVLPNPDDAVAAKAPAIDGKPNLDVEDLVHIVAANMVADVEWPYTEKPFQALYASLPGMRNEFM